MVDREVALDRKCDTLIESFVVHLPFVGQIGPDYEGKHPLLVSFSSNVPSWIVEDISLPKSELENISYSLYTPIYLNIVATPC